MIPVKPCTQQQQKLEFLSNLTIELAPSYTHFIPVVTIVFMVHYCNVFRKYCLKGKTAIT